MNLLTLRDTKFYQILQQRNTSNSKMYAGVLLPIESDLSDVLQYIKREFPDFPDHGMQHSLRILNYISAILTEMELESLSDTELFCLIISSFFHDTGMAYANEENKNAVRQNHHEYAESVIENYFNDKLNILNKKNRIKSVVIFSCKAHGMKLDDLYKDANFDKIDTIDSDEVRYSLIAILLRIGDLMDLENDRTNSFILSSFDDIYTKNAYDHNVRHIQINFYHYSAEQLNAEVEAQNPNQYKIWSKWFQYLDDEILHANTYLKKFNFFFPQPDMIIKKEDGADFDVEELRFEIDENGGIWNIISKSIYTDEFDFLRELIQNAIDASLVNIYNDLSINQLNISPRSWNSDQYCQNIVVAYSEESNKLCVIDFGIGMDVNDLHRFLFKVSSSGYTDSPKRNFAYPSLSKYGIGFVSCLINADKIEIYTRKHDDKFMHYVSMDSNVNLAFIQNITPDDYIGTSIVLTLKHKFSYTNIENYIKTTFRYPSVKIDCVSIDSLKDISEKMNISQKFDAINEKPYKINDIYNKIFKQHSRIVDKINMKKDIYQSIHAELLNIIDWFEDNVYYDEKYSDTKKFNYFKRNLDSLTNKINQYDFVSDVPLSTNKINIKDMFNTDTYINSLKSYEEVISSEEASLQKSLQYYGLSHYRINNENLSMKFDWKYCVVFFDNDLKIRDICFSKEPLDLSTGSGIIFIYHTNSDYDQGIEYSAINGFLFADGEIHNGIAHFTRYEKQAYEKRNESGVVIGIHNDMYSMKEELENHFWENFYDYENNDDFYSYRTNDGSYELGIIYKEIYDTITIKNNDFLFVFNKELNSYSGVYDNDNLFLNSSSLIDQVTKYYMSYMDTSDVDELVKLLSIVTENIYQDGIRIPFNVTDLIPFGYFRIICNLTAKSRMMLNVTRHKPSENKDDMADWMHTAGSNIQKTILNFLNKELKKLHLCVNFKGLDTRDLKFDWFSDSYNKILLDLK